MSPHSIDLICTRTSDLVIFPACEFLMCCMDFVCGCIQRIELQLALKAAMQNKTSWTATAPHSWSNKLRLGSSHFLLECLLTG